MKPRDTLISAVRGHLRLLAAFAVIVTAAIAGVIFITSNSQAAKPTVFSVLQKPSVPLPVGSLTGPLTRANTDSRRDAHLAFARGTSSYFVIAPPKDAICLDVVRPSVAASNCLSRSHFEPDDVMYITHQQPNGVMEIYGVVSDSVTTVSAGGVSGAVSSNVFSLERVPVSATSLTLTGPGLTREVDIGQQLPPGVTVAPDPSS